MTDMQAKSPLAAEYDDLAAEIADQAATNQFMDRYLNDNYGGEPMAPPDFVNANTLTKDVNDIDGRDIGAANADDKVGPDIGASDANRLSVHRATSGELVFGQGSASINANATVLRDSQGRLMVREPVWIRETPLVTTWQPINTVRPNLRSSTIDGKHKAKAPVPLPTPKVANKPDSEMATPEGHGTTSMDKLVLRGLAAKAAAEADAVTSGHDNVSKPCGSVGEKAAKADDDHGNASETNGSRHDIGEKDEVEKNEGGEEDETQKEETDEEDDQEVNAIIEEVNTRIAKSGKKIAKVSNSHCGVMAGSMV